MRLGRHLLMLAAVAACAGDDSPSTVLPADASPMPSMPVDASPPTEPDASAPAIPPAPIRVRVDSYVYSSSSPMQGATVLVHGRDGTIVARGVTDSAGTMAAVSADAVAVTVVVSPYELFTIGGVEPGDEVRVVPIPGPTIDAPDIHPSMRVTVPSQGTGRYRVTARCGTPVVTDALDDVTVVTDHTCGNDTDIVVVRYDEQGNAEGYMVAKGIPIVPDRRVELQPPWLAPFTAYATVRGVDERNRLKMQTLLLDDVRDPFGVVAAFETPDLNGAGPRRISLAGDVGRAALWLDPGGTIYGLLRLRVLADVEVDLSAMPEVSSSRTIGRTMSWSHRGGAAYDGILATLAWASSRRWHFVLPPGTASYDIPALPPDLGHLSPIGSDPVPQVTAFELSAVAGWGEYRRRGFNHGHVRAGGVLWVTVQDKALVSSTTRLTLTRYLSAF